MSDLGPRAVLLINAGSRRGQRALDSSSADLQAHGLTIVDAIRVRNPHKLVPQAERLLRQKPDRLIVGGGDGTLSQIAPLAAREHVTLGILPLGTANDFARTLGLPTDLKQAALVASGQKVTDVDLARANGEFFLNVASVGMSVAAIDRLSPDLKRWFGPFAYAMAGARAFFQHSDFAFEIKSDGVDSGTAHQVVVANGRFYGGGVLVDEGSTLEDGVLTAYGLGTRSRWDLLRTIALQKMRVPLQRPGEAFIRTDSLVLATEPSLPVNLDGEIRTRTPVEFSVVEKALRVLVPET